MSISANQPTADVVALLSKLGAITPQKPMRLVLEPRVVFDAAGVALAADAVDVPDAATAADATAVEADAAATHAGLVEALQSSEPASEVANIVFIDAGVTDAETLANAAQPDSEVVFLTADRDGMEQIAQYLEGRSGIGAVHILSHGDTGEVRLGDSALTTASIAGDHADELAIIKAALSADADILIYGCDVSNGASGGAFVNALAAATGADIAASTDDTGHADLGGDWELETVVGQIEAEAIAATDWHGRLVLPQDVYQYDSGTGEFINSFDVGAPLNTQLFNSDDQGGTSKIGFYDSATGTVTIMNADTQAVIATYNTVAGGTSFAMEDDFSLSTMPIRVS